MRATSSPRPIPSSRSSAAISSAASSAGRFGRTGRSSSPTIRASGRRSDARSSPPCRRCCSARACSPKPSAAACRSSTIRRRPLPVRRRSRAARSPATRFPLDRMDPVARALLAALSAADERRHRQQLPPRWTTRRSIRISSACASITGLRPNRDQVFGRLTRFREDVHPGDAAARRQRRDDRHARARRTRRPGRSRPAISARSRSTCSTSCASATRGGRVGRTAAQLDGAASTSLGLPGIPSNAQFPNTLPTFLIARLSAARIAAEHGVRFQHERDARSPTR